MEQRFTHGHVAQADAPSAPAMTVAWPPSPATPSAAGDDVDRDVEGIVRRLETTDKRVRAMLKKTLSARGLTPEDLAVLSSLRRQVGHVSSPGTLARDLGVSKGTISSRLKRLERLGYVSRATDNRDRRAVRVELGDRSHVAWEAAVEVRAEMVAVFASALTKAEQQTLNDILRRLLLACEHLHSQERASLRYGP